MLALVASLKEEVSGLLRQLSLQETTLPRGWRLHMGRLGGRGVLVAQTGMGRDRVERAAQFLLDRYPITCLLSFGFAGALTTELRAGDILVCREVLGIDGRGPRRRLLSDPAMADLAIATLEAYGARFSSGCGLTVAGLASGPEEKHALGMTSGALAVDMESYWVAAMAAERRVPFLAVRAVSDLLSQPLPPLDRFIGSDGETLLRAAALHFASHPADLAGLPGVYRNAGLARRSLTRFMGLFVPQIPHELDRETYRSRFKGGGSLAPAVGR